MKLQQLHFITISLLHVWVAIERLMTIKQQDNSLFPVEECITFEQRILCISFVEFDTFVSILTLTLIPVVFYSNLDSSSRHVLFGA